MKKVILFSALVAGVFIALTAGTMSDNGKAGVTGSPGELDCTDCHSSYALNAGGGSVTAGSTNMTGWMYDPGVTYHMTLTVARSANSLFGIGAEILTASNQNAGTIVITDATHTVIKTKTVSGVSRRNLVHTLNGGAATGSKVFTFDWTAPAAGTGDATMYFCGVAANGNGNENSDYVYLGSQVIAENINNGVSSIEKSSNVSVYPNPIADHFAVDYTVSTTGPVQINMYNMNGALVAKLASKMLSAGTYNDNFYLPSELSAGTYLLSIESASGVTSKKLMVK